MDQERKKALDPQHLRIGFCGTTERVRGGLERMSAGL